MSRNNTSPNDCSAEQIKQLLRMITQLKFGVSHNLRASISSASGLIVLLASEQCAAEDRQKMLSYLQATIDNMELHTRDIMHTLVELEKAFGGKSGDDKRRDLPEPEN